MKGTIVKPDMDGFGGLILGDDGREYFAHQSEYLGNNRYKKAKPGMRVIFDYLDNGYDKPRAVNINLLTKGKFSITVVLDMDCNKPYPEERAVTFATACKNTLEKYRREVEATGGKMEYDLIFGKSERFS